jgi:hypothetical protein
LKNLDKSMNFNYLILKKFFNSHGTLVLFITSVLYQIILLKNFMNNEITTKFYPLGSDADDYAALASVWKDEGFFIAFNELLRAPGFPAIIFMVGIIFPDNTFFVLRILQLTSIALTVVMINKILELHIPKSQAYIFSLIYLVLPIWYFVPAILAESFTTFFFTLLLYYISLSRTNKYHLPNYLIISGCLAILIYLKANSVLLVIPVLYFAIHKIKIKKFFHLFSILVLLMFLMLPWMIYAKTTQGSFLPLTNTSGYALYYGTGMIVKGDPILKQAATENRVNSESNIEDLLVFDEPITASEMSKIYTNKTIEIWSERPLNQFLFGLQKIMINFGFIVRNSYEYFLGFFSLITIIASLSLIKQKKHLDWAFTFIIYFFCQSFQAMIFFSEKRYLIPTFIPISIIVLSLAVSKLIRSWKSF